MAFTVTILGSNSAKPAYGRHPSAQVLMVNEKFYLIDCGEGTQMQMDLYGVKVAKIDHIFISHLHGDHYLGLIPLLDTLGLSRRKKAMHLFAPAELEQILALHYKVSAHGHLPPFPIVFHAIDANNTGLIYENADITVHTLPMDHRIPCTGFLFTQKAGQRKMIAEKIAQYQIPYSAIPAIKEGGDFVDALGNVVPNEAITEAPTPPGSYAYCSDTAYNEALLPYINKVSVLYHESTYLSEMQDVAQHRGHATAIDAARMALAANAGCLYLGHFSSRYGRLDRFLKEAHPFFPNTFIASEGLVIQVTAPHSHL